MALVVALTPNSAQAADPIAIQLSIDRGTLALESAQDISGAFGSRLKPRDTAVAVEAMRLTNPMSAAIGSAATYAAALETDNIDDLGRLAVAFPALDFANRLQAEQHPDGGFGLTAEYEPDPLDTALALEALVVDGDSIRAKRALDRLLKFSNLNGSWGEDDVALSAESLLAIARYRDRYGPSAGLDFMIAKSSQWLVSIQQSDGSWGVGTAKNRATASVITALASSSHAFEVIAGATDALIAAQSNGGSWGDPFTTGLALRALHFAAESFERDRFSALPDPTILSRDIATSSNTVDVGQSVTLTASVSNVGAATGSGVTVQFFVGEPGGGRQPSAEVSLPDLAPSTSVPVNATVPIESEPGRRRVYVVLIPRAGEDRNLSNNASFANVYVRRPLKAASDTRDWPRSGRDARRSSTTPNNLHAGIDPNPVWRHLADGGAIAAEGKVFFGQGGTVNAVDAVSGVVSWQAGAAHTDPSLYRPPIYSRGLIYTGGMGAYGAYSAATGFDYGSGAGGSDSGPTPFIVEFLQQEQWYDGWFQFDASQNSDCNYLAPAGDITGGNFNLWGDEDYIHFERPCEPRTWGMAYDGTKAYVTTGPGYLLAFDPATAAGPNGEPSSYYFDVKIPNVTVNPAPPLVDSIGQIVTAGWEGDVEPSGAASHSGRGRVVAFDAESGSAYWSFATDSQLDGTPVEFGGSILVVDRSGKLYALDQTTGELQWTWQAPNYLPPPPNEMQPSGQTLAISNNYLYVPHPDGNIYTLDARSGAQSSATHFPGRPYDLAIDDKNNSIYVRTLDGYVGAYPTRELPDQCPPDPANDPDGRKKIVSASVYTDGSPIPGSAMPSKPSFSDDGQMIAFEMLDPSGVPRAYVRDLRTGVTTEEPATETVGVGQTRLDSRNPELSGDGKHLAYSGRVQIEQSWTSPFSIFVRNRDSGALDTPLRDGVGEFADPGVDQGRSAIDISEDGSAIVFSSANGSIVDDDVDGQNDVFLMNRTTGTRSIVSVDSNGGQVSEPSYGASISGDGRFVAFQSEANLVGAPPATDSTGNSFPFVYDTVTGQLIAVTLNSDGELARGSATTISANGRYVTFSSDAASLVPPELQYVDGSPLGVVDSYVFDLQQGTRTTVSLNSQEGRPMPASSDNAVASDDGQRVAFSSYFEYAKGDAHRDNDVMMRDVANGTTSLISANPYGVATSGSSEYPSLAPGGDRVAFVSTATDLTSGDVDAARDVFVWAEDGWSTTTAPTTGDPNSSCPVEPGENGADFSDLSVESTDISGANLETGTPGEIGVHIENEGPAGSDQTTVRLYDGNADTGTLLGEQEIAALDAGSATNLTFSWNPAGAAGTHSMTVIVDPDRSVFEQNLANNEAVATVQVAASNFDLEVSSAQTSYAADADVQVSASVSTNSIVERSGDLSVWIEDSDGDRVADLSHTRATATPAAPATFSDVWNSLDTTAGTYTIKAELADSDGSVLVSDTTAFDITPDVQLSLEVQADRSEYESGESARIDSFVTNRSRNSALESDRVDLEIKDSSGAVVDATSEPAGEVVQGGAILVTHAKPLTGLSPGEYHVESRLVGANGSQLAAATTTFSLASSAATGAGVRGAITATPNEPPRATNFSLAYSMSNSGNADVIGASAIVRIADLTTGDVVKTLTAQRDIPQSTTVASAFSSVADMPENRDYQVGLYVALPSGVELPLDRAIIHVKPVPFVIGAEFSSSPLNRILVWACDPGDEAVARAALGDTFAHVVPNLRTERYRDHGILGCTVFNHDEETEFIREMRSGNYNQFWILGKHHPFEGFTGEELGARVAQGDGLLVAGNNPTLDLFAHCSNISPLGVKFNGILPPGQYAINFNATSAFADLDATISGRPAKVTTKQATAIGTTPYRNFIGPTAAITATTNQFGAGKAIFIGAPPSVFTDPARAAAILQRAATHLTPASTVTGAGGMARLDLWVEGIAPGSPLEVRTQLPAGSSAPQAPSDVTLVGDLLTVPFPTVGTQRKTRSVWLKLPATPPSITTSSTAYYQDATDGQMKPVGGPAGATLALGENKQTAAQSATSALDAITGAYLFDVLLLQKIKNDVTAATQPAGSPLTIWLRMNALVLDLGMLERKSLNGAPIAHLAVARLVTYLEYDYYLATAGG